MIDDRTTEKSPRPAAPVAGQSTPHIPDHELLRLIGKGGYGEVWLARNIMGSYRAVKIIYRSTFEHHRPYEREFEGIKRYEHISRKHDSQVAILHVGRHERDQYYFYVMELADDANAECGMRNQVTSLPFRTPHSAFRICIRLALWLPT